MTKLKVVCVGAGYFSKFHVEAWKRLPEAEIVAICDLEKEKAQALADEFSVPNVYSTVQEAEEKISYDILDIITPPASHMALCEHAAAHNHHIICQKPLAPSYAEAQVLAQKMNKYKGLFMVHENFRFQPWYRMMKTLLDQKVIGENIFGISHRMRMGDGWPDDAYLNRQPYFRKMPRLLIHETGIHFIDVFRYLIGDVESVYAKLKTLNKYIAGEDKGVVFFEFENGCHGIYDANRYNESNADDPRYTFGKMLIEGDKGAIRLYTDGSLHIQKLGQKEVKVDYTPSKDNFAGDCVYNTQQHFVDCVLRGDSIETNVDDYLKNLQVEEAIYNSSKHRKEVKINEIKNVI